MGIRKFDLIKLEALLRLLAFCMLGLSALVMGIDTQTKVLFGLITRKADFKVTKTFISSVYVNSIGSGYSLVQLIRCLCFTKYHGDKLTSSSHLFKWISFLLDQMAMYLVFATSCASSEFSFLEVFGAESLQWMKACNKFTRFCFQIGVSLALSLLGWVLLAVISGISAFHLFRWYSPKRFVPQTKKGLGNRPIATTTN